MNEDGGLQRFGAYEKALTLFDLVVTDLSPLGNQSVLQRLISQPFASADSISSNIEEGFGRGSRREYSQFLIIARGSAQETSGRYGRFKHWLPVDVIAARQALCGEIIGILSGSIKTLRREQ
ncbi:MAG TPA: four helix bundle protein [Opitutus sp.]|nr:four helix bundle protein [Opitutus sp.]